MTKTDILDAINRLLVEQWPTRTVYVDVCPVDFERPSFWLAVEKDDQTDANRVLIRHDLQLRLTLYDQLDEHYEASWYRLSQETDTAALPAQPCADCGRAPPEATAEDTAPGSGPGLYTDQHILVG